MMHLTLVSAADVVLWIGTAVVLGCYAYNSWFTPTSKRRLILYQVWNVIGSVCFIWGMYIKNVPQSMVLNLIWGGIGLVALWKLLR